jgi:hypothetical protein
MARAAEARNAKTHTMDLDKLKQNLATTGFVLEHSVATLLRRHSWSVISNKYYVDDVQEAVREIDLVAYKAARLKEFVCYTTLIISCKKSDENVWALLARPINRSDPNVDWYPQQTWTNVPALGHVLKTGWPSDYLEHCKGAGVFESLMSPARHIFAFQEIAKTSLKPQNDARIFASVTSLMKAQGHEIAALAKRKEQKAIYVFHLLSVADTELVRLDFQDDGAIDAASVTDELYVGSYIINKQDTVSRIHFVTAKRLPSVLPHYDTLHDCNARYFEQAYADFYSDPLTDDKRAGVFDELFQANAGVWLNEILRDAKISEANHSFYVRRQSGTQAAVVYCNADRKAVAYLATNDYSKYLVTRNLKALYKFGGYWTFESDSMPF